MPLFQNRTKFKKGTARIYKALNVKCFATVGSSEKKDFIDKLNIERCINYQIEDFEKIIKNDYSGVDVILDIVGGEYFQKNINILNKYGRLINIAYLNGSKVEVDLIPIMLKRLLISGSTLRVRSNKEKQEIANQLRENIWPLIENKTIELFIDKKYEYIDVRDAHKYMENNKNIRDSCSLRLKTFFPEKNTSINIEKSIYNF